MADLRHLRDVLAMYGGSVLDFKMPLALVLRVPHGAIDVELTYSLGPQVWSLSALYDGGCATATPHLRALLDAYDHAVDVLLTESVQQAIAETLRGLGMHHAAAAAREAATIQARRPKPQTYHGD